jgi:hypothetical protein
MNQPPAGTPASAQDLITVLTGALLVALFPLLPVSPVEMPAAVSASVLALALAAFALVADSLGTLAARTPTTAGLVTAEVPPVLAGRITDCVHNPVRPRAPGTV